MQQTFSTGFQNNTQISSFMKIRLVGAEIFHTDGRTDRETRMTKLIVVFRNFSNSPTNWKFRLQNVLVCFMWIWEQTAIISPYLIGFYSRDEMRLLRGTDWIFVCFVWIWEQTAIISPFLIGFYSCDEVRLQRGAD
jgi:hypothetical protein